MVRVQTILKRRFSWLQTGGLTLILSVFITAQSANPNYEDLARETFEVLSDEELTNAQELDKFIQIYEGTDQANIAFTLRFNLTRSSFDIGVYNEFIEHYGDTVAGQLAVTEVYELYQLRDEVPSYLNFMELYPNSRESFLAKLRVHNLLFDLATAVYESDQFSYETKLDILYDFIFSNQDAPQVPAAEMLAKMLEVEHQLRIRRDWEEQGGQEPCRKASTELYIPLNQLWRFLDNVDQDNVTQEELRVSYDVQRSIFALETVYSECFELAIGIRDQEQFEISTDLLRKINEDLIQTNQELIEVVITESEKTRTVLSEIVNQLGEVNENLTNLHEGLNEIATKLDGIQQSVERQTNVLSAEIRRQTDVLNEAIQTTSQQTQELLVTQIQATNQLAEGLHNDLIAVHSSIVDMNADMNAGFTEQIMAVNSLSDNVEEGFGQLIAVETASYEEQRRTRIELVESLDTNFANVVGRLDAQITQDARFHYQTLRHNETLSNNLITTMNDNTGLLLESDAFYGNMISSTIQMGNDQIVYRLDTVNNTVREVGTNLGREIVGFRGDLNAYASQNNSLMAQLVSTAYGRAPSAGQARASDFIHATNMMLGVGPLDPSVSSGVTAAVGTVCQDYNNNNTGDLPCEDIQRMIREGRVDYSALGQAGGEYACQLLGSDSLDCGAVGEVLADGIREGGFSVDGLANLSVDFACQELGIGDAIGVGCGDLGNVAMFAGCIYTFECSGTIDWATDAVGDVLPGPLADVVSDVGGVVDEVTGGVMGAVTDVIGGIGDFF